LPYEVIKKNKLVDINFKNTSRGPFVPRDFRISAQEEARQIIVPSEFIVTERIKERTSFHMEYYVIELTKVSTLRLNKVQLEHPIVSFEFEVELKSESVKSILYIEKNTEKYEGIIKHFIAVICSISNALREESTKYIAQ